MKISLKGKSIIKKVALALAGVAALTAVGFGVKAIVDYTKEDLKTISLSFEVGNLGADGKFVDDESTLYTKEAFACDGLQLKLDFDNQINYQIYFYDDLDNFIESTAVLSESYSGCVHDSYARLVIIPTNDEDDKISFTERFTYPKQLTIKVNNVQDSYYSQLYDSRFRFVNEISLLRFYRGDFTLSSNSLVFSTGANHNCITSKDVLCVKGGEKVEFNYPKTGDKIGVLRLTQIKQSGASYIVTHFDETLVSTSGENKVITIDKDTDYLMFKFYFMDSSGQVITTALSDSVLTSISSSIIISK